MTFVVTQSQHIKVQCNFLWFPGSTTNYVCELSDLSITENDILNQNFTFGGQHVSGLSNNDVIRVNLTSSQVPVIFSQVFLAFSSLTRLDVSSRLTHIQPNAFSDARSLTHLSLPNNLLTTLPAAAFAGASNLIFLNLRFNSIDFIHENAFSASNLLDFINLDYNKLREIFPNVFRPLIRLDTIYLRNNFIERLHGDLFSHNQQLYIMSFLYNQINAIDRRFLDQVSEPGLLIFGGNLCTNNVFANVSKEVILAGLERCFENYEKVPQIESTF